MTIGQRFYLAPAFLGTPTLVFADPAVLYECDAQNLSGIDLWLMIFDAVTAPAPATLPLYSFKITDGTSFALAPPSGPNDVGRPFDVGIVAAWSATAIYDGSIGAYGDSTIYLAGRAR